MLPDRPWVRLALVTALFAALAPLLGALFGLLLLTGFAMVGSDAAFGPAFSGHFAKAMQAGLASLYLWPLLAILPASGIGVFFGWHQGWRGPVPLVGAVLAGGGVGAIYFLISEFLGWGMGAFGASFAVVLGGLTVLALFPMLRLMARNDRQVL